MAKSSQIHDFSHGNQWFKGYLQKSVRPNDVPESSHGLMHYYTAQHIPGWWLGHPSEKYELVNWDDEIPNINGTIKNGNQTTNQ